MSKENVQKFYELLAQDAAVVEELKAIVVDSVDKIAEAIIAFAKSKGMEFTTEDITAFEQDAKQELSTEELECVTGGLLIGHCTTFGRGPREMFDGRFILCSASGIGIPKEHL